MKSRWVVVAGGELAGADLGAIRPGDRVVAVDGGVRALRRANLPIHLAVGDFDTLGPRVPRLLKEAGIPVKRLPAEKDMTDTQYAVETAIAEGAQEILVLGALGGARFDHALANLFLLEKIEAAGIPGVIENSSNRIRLHPGAEKELWLERGPFPYVSLLALTERVEGVSLEGFRYPLCDATLYRQYPRGISNELTARRGKIRIRRGKLLVVESRD
ncbi:thiamine diphosphokinase [Kroppenstedtia eburnea]|uniref:thiamine diphosphokinase n=1 Tax=Kroppenstedtia eburnea TaxID=714067 RepID=UPI00363B10F9